MALTAAGLATGCSRVQGSEPKPARPVRVQAVAVAPPPAGIRYSATVEAYQQIPLAFKASGYVDRVAQRPGADGRLRAAQAGDRVTGGTLLARVNEADYRERVGSGRAKVAEGEAALTKARLDLERARTLFRADSLTRPELDAAQASFDTAEARIAAARAEVVLAESSLRDCALVAPATGVLLERKIEVGSLVGTGSVGFVLGDVSQVKARFGIPDSMIQAVKPGDRIGVIVDAVAGATFAGRVTALAPAADPQSRVFDVEVTIPNADGRLRPGMIGTVVLGPAAEQSASVVRPLVVPLTAVIKSPGETEQFAVLVVERQGDITIARMRRVELGDVLGNGVAVLKGLSAGDRIIITGSSLLVDGEPVHVIP
jgi:multidrug efflux system membrane fusion protein